MAQFSFIVQAIIVSICRESAFSVASHRLKVGNQSAFGGKRDNCESITVWIFSQRNDVCMRGRERVEAHVRKYFLRAVAILQTHQGILLARHAGNAYDNS